MRIIIIALWPIIFLVAISHIDRALHLRRALTFHSAYIFWLVGIYVLSGGLFAVSGFYKREYSNCKWMLAAHIASGLFVALFSIFWYFAFQHSLFLGGQSGREFFLVRVNPGLLALVFGYVIYCATRTIVFYIRKD